MVFSNHHFTKMCSGPTHQFLVQSDSPEWVRIRRRVRVIADKIQPHCGLETNVHGQSGWPEQGVWVARQIMCVVSAVGRDTLQTSILSHRRASDIKKTH